MTLTYVLALLLAVFVLGGIILIVENRGLNKENDIYHTRLQTACARIYTLQAENAELAKRLEAVHA